MKRKEVFRSAMLAMALFVMQSGQAQVSVEQNFPASPGTDYVGWDNSTNVPLMIRHDNDQPIDWYTEAIRRITLLPDATYAIGPFAGQVKNGSMLLSPDVVSTPILGAVVCKGTSECGGVVDVLLNCGEVRA